MSSSRMRTRKGDRLPRGDGILWSTDIHENGRKGATNYRHWTAECPTVESTLTAARSGDVFLTLFRTVYACSLFVLTL